MRGSCGTGPCGTRVGDTGEKHSVRIKVFEDLSRPERSALMELSRAVCTGHRGLLAEAGSLGVAAFEPWQLQVALGGDAIGELVDDPVAGVLPATA